MQRETITLQLGNFANYSATHFWNAQYCYDDCSDEIELTRLFHYKNRTPHPRTVIVDLKDNYGHAISRSFESSATSTEINSEGGFNSWEGPFISYVQAPKSKSEYHQLWDFNSEKDIPFSTSQISSWDDYNYPQYHPKTMVPLPYFSIPEAFEEGSGLFQENEWGNNLIETHLRYFAEACDHLADFQVWATLDDAFSGIFIEAALLLSDLYPKVNVVAHTFSFDIHRNLALTTSQLCDIEIMHWCWSSSKAEFYSTSAWPCVGIDTFLQSHALVSTPSSIPNLIVPHLQSSCYSPFQPGMKCITFQRGSCSSPASESLPNVTKIHLDIPFPCPPSFPIHSMPQFTMSLYQPATVQPLYPYLSQDQREPLNKY